MAQEDFYDTLEHPLLDEDTFQNEHSQRLFEGIDELRSCGADHDIDLPELVIVGDQSAGKSSLLQSLTEIPFPVADRLCTRFPIRIVSRRTPNEVECIKISIEAKMMGGFFPVTQNQGAFPSANGPNRFTQYAEFARTVPSITATEFKAVVEEASNLMGISPSSLQESDNTSSPFGPPKRNFSSDILKVEISGPTRSYFSILDVPGVFQSLTKGLKEDEKIGVHQMVTSFMTPKQSIIICVASGTNDLANQAAFDMAAGLDPDGERTVGVITKCDVTQHINQVMELAKNQEKRLHHGWFVVRNRTPLEAMKNVNAASRDTKEQEFFNIAPWNSLHETRRGTQALKKFLADLLSKRIQETFPKMREIIRARLSLTEAELESLGAYRETPEQRRTYLTTIAQHFYSLALDALRGRYDSIKTDDMKLRMKVRRANDAFASDMRLNGQSFAFVPIPNPGYNQSVGSSSGLISKPANSATGMKSQTGGLFGGFSFPKSGNPNVGFRCPRTKDEPFHPYQTTVIEFENEPDVLFQNISSMPTYRSYSFEELRLSDYAQDHPKASSSEGAQSGTSILGNLQSSSGPGEGLSIGGLFQPSTSKGVQKNPSSGTSLFGNPQSSSGGGENLSTGGLFQPTSKGVQKNPSSGTSLFGNPQSTSGAGENLSTGGLFQPTSKGVQKNSSSGTSFFGNPQSSSGAGENLSTGGLFQPPTSKKVDKSPSSGTSISENPNSSSKTDENLSTGGLFQIPTSKKIDKNSSSGTSILVNLQPNSGAVGSQISASAAAAAPASLSNPFLKYAAQSTSFPKSFSWSEPENRLSSPIYNWIRNEVATSRGTELQGTLNPDILPVLFHRQASKWKTIAEAHFVKIRTTTLITALKILDTVCPNLNTRTEVKTLIEEANAQGKARGLGLLSQRLEEVLSGHLQTSNPAFEAHVREARLLRFQGAIERYRAKTVASGPTLSNSIFSARESTDTKFTIDIRDTAALFTELHISNSQNLEDEIHDTLKAYYELARDDFIEFVNHIIVERYLNDPQGPVLLFSPLYVGGLNNEKLESLTAETKWVMRERAQVKATLERLSRAEEIAVKYA